MEVFVMREHLEVILLSFVTCFTLGLFAWGCWYNASHTNRLGGEFFTYISTISTGAFGAMLRAMGVNGKAPGVGLVRK